MVTLLASTAVFFYFERVGFIEPVQDTFGATAVANVLIPPTWRYFNAGRLLHTDNGVIDIAAEIICGLWECHCSWFHSFNIVTLGFFIQDGLLVHCLLRISEQHVDMVHQACLAFVVSEDFKGMLL